MRDKDGKISFRTFGIKRNENKYMVPANFTATGNSNKHLKKYMLKTLFIPAFESETKSQTKSMQQINFNNMTGLLNVLLIQTN